MLESDACTPATGPGTTAFNVSTGGVNLRSFENKPAYMVKRFSDTYGWLSLSLHPDGSFDWRFVPVVGNEHRQRHAAGTQDLARVRDGRPAGPRQGSRRTTHATLRTSMLAVLAWTGRPSQLRRVLAEHRGDDDQVRPVRTVVDEQLAAGR